MNKLEKTIATIFGIASINVAAQEYGKVAEQDMDEYEIHSEYDFNRDGKKEIIYYKINNTMEKFNPNLPSLVFKSFSIKIMNEAYPPTVMYYEQSFQMFWDKDEYARMDKPRILFVDADYDGNVDIQLRHLTRRAKENAHPIIYNVMNSEKTWDGRKFYFKDDQPTED